MFRSKRALLAAALAAAAGCGEPTAPAENPAVAGRVVVRGVDPSHQSPLEGSRLRFESANDPALVGVASVDTDGSFTASTVQRGAQSPGLPPGEYRVRVDPPREKDGSRLPLVAKKYLDAKTSGLTLTVPPSGDVVLEVERPAAR